MLRRIGLIAFTGTLGLAALTVVQLRAGALLGSGSELDGFFAGAAIPSLFLSLSSAVVIQYITPRLVESSRRSEAVSEAVGLAIGLGLLASFVVVVAAPLIVAAIIPGSTEATRDTAVDVLRIYSIGFAPHLGSYAYSALGFANGRVWASGVSSTAYGAIWLALLFVPAFERSPRGLALAGAIATLIQLVVAFECSGARASTCWPRRPRKAAAMRARGPIIALVVVAVFSKGNLVLDPFVGSLAATGAVASLVYAYRVALIFGVVSGQGSGFALLGSRRSDIHDQRERAIAVVAAGLIGAGVAAAVAIAFRQVSPQIFSHGKLTLKDADVIADLVILYAPLIAISPAIWSLESLLFSTYRTNEVLRRNAVNLAVNIAFSIVLVLAIGTSGRPIAVDVAAIGYVLLLVHALRREAELRMIRKGQLLLWIAALAAAAACVAFASSYLAAAGGVSRFGAGLLACIGALAVTAVFVLRQALRGWPLVRVSRERVSGSEDDIARDLLLVGEDLS